MAETCAPSSAKAAATAAPTPPYRAGDHDPSARKCIVAKLGFHVVLFVAPALRPATVLCPRTTGRGAHREERPQQLLTSASSKTTTSTPSSVSHWWPPAKSVRFADDHCPDAEIDALNLLQYQHGESVCTCTITVWL